MKYFLIMFCLLLPSLLLAHGKEEHSEKQPKKMMSMHNNEQQMKQMHSNVNLEYKKYVRPTFQTKCFDCHGEVEKYPWYIKLPGIKQFMEYDIRESKKHLDMTNDFPFGGHGEPLNDIESIRKAVEEGTMPPLRYRLAHWDSRLNKEEKKVLKEWIDSAKKLLTK